MAPRWWRARQLGAAPSRLRLPVAAQHRRRNHLVEYLGRDRRHLRAGARRRGREDTRLRIGDRPRGTASAVSNSAGPVAMAPPINTGRPRWSAPPSRRHAHRGVGSWDPAAETFTYAWQRAYGSGGFQAIPGATQSTYVVAPNDLGDRIRVIVTATNPDGTAAVTSQPTATIAPAPVVAVAPAPSSTSAPAPAPQATAPSAKFLPSLSGGQDGVGAKLTVKGGVFAGAPVTRAVIRVMRCTHNCVAVGAPNTRTYKISAADAGAVCASPRRRPAPPARPRSGRRDRSARSRRATSALRCSARVGQPCAPGERAALAFVTVPPASVTLRRSRAEPPSTCACMGLPRRGRQRRAAAALQRDDHVARQRHAARSPRTSPARSASWSSIARR